MGLSGSRTQEEALPNRWLRRSLQELDSLRYGMTRDQVACMLGPAGGLSFPFHAENCWYRDCNFIQVTLSFCPRGGPHYDAQGGVSNQQDPGDVVTDIDGPYLAQPAYD